MSATVRPTVLVYELFDNHSGTSRQTSGVDE